MLAWVAGPGLAGEAEPRAQRPIALEEAVRLALEQNLRLAAEKLNPQRAATAVTEEKAAFDPTAFSEMSVGNLHQEPRQEGWETKRKQYSAAAGIVKLFELGTQVEARVGASRTRSGFRDPPDELVNPAYEELASVTVAQPLLRGFGIRVNTARIAAARNEQRAALAQLRHVALQTVADTQKGYWELVFALRDRDLVQRSVGRAEELRQIVQTRVAAKALGPQDPEVQQARTELSLRQEQLVAANEAVGRVEDFLKVITDLASDRAVWRMALVPTTEPVATAPAVDPDLAVEAGLLNRPDYYAAKVAIETRDIALDVARNDLLPRLDLQASLAATGLGDTVPHADRSFESLDSYQWSVGVRMEVPLGNRAARARYRRATLERRQALLQLELFERQIQLEVRNAVRQVTTNVERLRAADETVRAAQDRLAAEQLLFKEGPAAPIEGRRRTTAQDVVFAQDALLQAERRRLRALIDLNTALVELERVKGTLLDTNNILFVGDLEATE